mmetsp:Transcript_146621/g.258372  ORF Transcript_146621/g.258372 Transcript_146621/m.258372 type:complete len:179 (+) Transcript_146621:81-617(+)
MSRLPKLQPPASDDARCRVAEASELARAGEMKAAQQALREAVAGGLIPGPTQRQVLAWWSAGEYSLPGFTLEADTAGKDTRLAASQPQEVAAPPQDEHEKTVSQVMRKNGWSRKAALEYIEQGGLEMEAYHKEMNAPMDNAFEQLKANGPPKWFVDAVKEKYGEGSEAAPATEAIANG